MSVKGQVLDDLLNFMESVRIKNYCSGSLGKRVYQVLVNCHIHLGYKMKEESTKDLTYVQVVSPNVVFGVSWLQGSRLILLQIKGLQPRGVSLYILNGIGSTILY